MNIQTNLYLYKLIFPYEYSFTFRPSIRHHIFSQDVDILLDVNQEHIKKSKLHDSSPEILIISVLRIGSIYWGELDGNIQLIWG